MSNKNDRFSGKLSVADTAVFQYHLNRLVLKCAVQWEIVGRRGQLVGCPLRFLKYLGEKGTASAVLFAFKHITVNCKLSIVNHHQHP